VQAERGHCSAQGRVALSQQTTDSVETGTVAVDTTVTNLLELTYISGNAGTTTTFQIASIERIKD
jgi:hypothetical protein